MKERFKQHENVAAGVRRIATLQLDAAIKAAAVRSDDQQVLSVAVHEVRKQTKKLRALLRLVRGAFDDYADEQRLLRDTARGLSRLRDAAARHETLQQLIQRHPGQVDGLLLDATGDQDSTDDPAERTTVLHRALATAGEALSAQRARVGDWQLRTEGFAALEDGLQGTYRRGRKALKALGDAPTADDMHLLRKAVKYHRHQLQYVSGSWTEPMKAWVKEAEQLGEYLGQHHDIAVLREHIHDSGAEGADKDFAKALASDLHRLERKARELSLRLYAESARCFTARMQHYWDAWRD